MELEERLTDRGQIQMLAYAYMGDSIYDCFVRSRLIMEHPDETAHRLHSRAVALVRCSAQAETIRAIYDHLTEQEKEIYRRGRNAKSPTVPKNASVTDYRMATGFEALLGYLYLHEGADKLKRVLALCEEFGWREINHG